MSHEKRQDSRRQVGTGQIRYEKYIDYEIDMQYSIYGAIVSQGSYGINERNRKLQSTLPLR